MSSLPKTLWRGNKRTDGTARGPRVQSNKPTTASVVKEILSHWDNEELRTKVNYDLLQLRPKGGGTYACLLIIRDRDGKPHIADEHGVANAKFRIGATHGTTVSGTGVSIQVKRSDLAVLEHVEIALSKGSTALPFGNNPSPAPKRAMVEKPAHNAWKQDLLQSLESYVTADDVTLERRAFLRVVADRINADLD